MTTQDYIKELKKYLSNLDNDKKNEILKEIESYIEESHIDYSILVERFGTPKELADGYLEDMPIKEQKSKTFLIKTKRVIITIASFLLIVFAIVAFFIYKFTQDPFDYSKYTASTINKEVDSTWIDLNNINQIKIEQAQVVLYWSKNDKLQYSCKGNSISNDGGTLLIKQSRCFIKVPNKKIDIKSFQAKIILIEPTNTLSLESEQTSLRIAEKNSTYKYDFSSKQSDVNNLTSKENGITINGKLFQSDLSSYKY